MMNPRTSRYNLPETPFISLHISEAAIQEQIAASEEIDGVRKEKERLTAASLKKNRNLQRKGKRFLKEKDPENEWLINNIRNQQITVYNQEFIFIYNLLLVNEFYY